MDEIVSIEEYSNISKRFDITVDGNHNFYANEILVHNCQNLVEELKEWQRQKFTWTVSEKCEGSSFSAIYNNGDFEVCSRNLSLKEVEGNTLWEMAKKYDLKSKLAALNRNLAVQAELLGPGIQSNIYQLKSHMLVVFDIYDIDKQEYLTPLAKKEMIEYLGLTSVPILSSNKSLEGMTIDDILAFAEGKSVMGLIGCEREGVVFNCNEVGASFKAVSNKYLMKSKD